MLWIVTTQKEIDGFIPNRKLPLLEKTLGANNVMRIVADEHTRFDNLCSKDGSRDFILCETRDKKVRANIAASGIPSSVESDNTVYLCEDKDAVKPLLESIGVKCPKTIHDMNEVVNGNVYFVKPKHGEDSNGIDNDCRCTTLSEVINKSVSIVDAGDEPIIEEFVEGRECTVALIEDGDGIKVFPISIDFENEYGIFTHEKKMSYEEECAPFYKEALIESATKAFKAIGCRNYMRIDYKVTMDGVPYLIDLNLYPGLGPIDHFGKCLSLCAGIDHKGMFDLITRTKE